MFYTVKQVSESSDLNSYFLIYFCIRKKYISADTDKEISLNNSIILITSLASTTDKGQECSNIINTYYLEYIPFGKNVT